MNAPLPLKVGRDTAAGTTETLARAAGPDAADLARRLAGETPRA